MILQAFTKPYCQMTVVDSFIVVVPILIITVLWIIWAETKQ